MLADAWAGKRPTTVHNNSKLPTRQFSAKEQQVPAINYPFTNTAFFALRCFANASKLPRVQGMRTGLPLNIL